MMRLSSVSSTMDPVGELLELEESLEMLRSMPTRLVVGT